MVTERTNSKEKKVMSEAIELYNSATFRVITDDRNPGKSEIWATQKEMSKAFGVNVPTVSKHIKDVLQSGELQKVAVVSKMETVLPDGRKYQTNCYNLKMIIAVGFRVGSELGIKFRQWANDVIEKYSTQGCAINLNAMVNGYRKSELFAMLAEVSKRCEEQEQKLLEQVKTVNEQNDIIKEQQSHIEWSDSQRISMAESCARFSPVKDKPCDDAKPVRGCWRKPAKCADGEFDSKRNEEYGSIIRRAIREKSLIDYELNEFNTVIEADVIKGTKHTKDECVLLDMYNAGHIGIIPTII